MAEAIIRLPNLHSKQQNILDHLGRFTVIDAGRRFGKNVLDVEAAVNTMLAGGPVGWFEPNLQEPRIDVGGVSKNVLPHYC